MERAKILVSLLAFFLTAVILQVVAVAASNPLVEDFGVTINGVENVSEGQVIAGFAGETIPIRVQFRAATDASDVRIKAWIAGYRSEIETETERFVIIEDSIYTKLLSLKLPYDIDPSEDYALVIRVENKTAGEEFTYTLKIQRGSYELEILDIETESEIFAGSVVPVEVVVKNRGMHELEDVFVKVSVEELGIEKKAYLGDLVPEDNCNDCDKEDTGHKTVYIKIPEDVESGIYTLKAKAYNEDASVEITERIVITSQKERVEIRVLPSAKTLGAGEEATFDLVLVNRGESVKVLSVMPEQTEGFIVTVDRPVVTLAPGSSEIVKVRIKVTEFAVVGVNMISIDVTEDSQIVGKGEISINVEEAARVTAPVVATIVLAVVFVVLLVILIVLLTRKPTKPEELETSYY